MSDDGNPTSECGHHALRFRTSIVVTIFSANGDLLEQGVPVLTEDLVDEWLVVEFEKISD